MSLAFMFARAVPKPIRTLHPILANASNRDSSAGKLSSICPWRRPNHAESLASVGRGEI